jgi:hypothetical protein
VHQVQQSFIPPQTEPTRRPERYGPEQKIRARHQRINADARSQAELRELACAPTLGQSASRLKPNQQNEPRDYAYHQIAQAIGDIRILASYMLPPRSVNDNRLMQVNVGHGKLRQTANVH